MAYDDGQVKDLVEKLQAGELTPKEAKKRLKERGLLEKEAWEIIPWVVYFILLIPLNLKFSSFRVISSNNSSVAAGFTSFPFSKDACPFTLVRASASFCFSLLFFLLIFSPSAISRHNTSILLGSRRALWNF